VLHMTSWRNFVTSRLMGTDTFQVAPEANFPKATNWADAINTFRKSQENLMSAVAAFPDTRLGELVPAASHKYTFYTLVHGILQHDIYHLGQIQLIRKSNM
ncbi:MAG: DinB family protein, partial [Cyclobacteriaceae bacterium]|nr:DinB family protein [Cyclobacteriaceae bacterium]